MEHNLTSTEYLQAVREIKSAILESRYQAARLVNREILSLYYAIGKYISFHSRSSSWGSNAIAVVSDMLQQELPGLRGFSQTNIKRMRLFYEAWAPLFENRPLATDDSCSTSICTQVSKTSVVIRPLLTDELQPAELDAFLSVGFTNHYEILAHSKGADERLFYILHCAAGFWSVEKLKYYLKDNLYQKEGRMPNNFHLTITDSELRRKALRSFKDDYLLSFVNIEDPDDIDERVIEQEIMHNIKSFIMALGRDFSFIGNQYRIIVSDKEYFIDLLFFNRRLQALIAIELKTGEFKPEYVGKLNFYLSALDEYVKLPHENPSIGIVLCKDKDVRTVEFAFRDLHKPMGVATYHTSINLPPQYQGILPEPDDLIKLM